MPQTIAVRVNDSTIAALRRGESVTVRLDRSNVVGGVSRRAGRRPGQNPQRLWFHKGGFPRAGSVPGRLLLWTIGNGGTITTRCATAVLRRGRVHASQALSQLNAAGLLRREQWARYAVTPKGIAAQAALGDTALYRAGTHRRRLAEWAMERQLPFGVADVSRLLGISRGSAHTVLKRLLRDRVVLREGPGVYRAR